MSNQILVLKFGGTSVSSKNNLDTIATIIQQNINNHLKPVVVVSALSGITNLLSKLALDNNDNALIQIYDIHCAFIDEVFDTQHAQIATEYLKQQLNHLRILLHHSNRHSLQHTDSVIAFGEIISSYFIALYLQSQQISTEQCISSQLIITNANFTKADFIKSATKRNVNKILLPMIKRGLVPVITGFIGATRDGHITTLGRGGSDYSAAIIGYVLKSQEIQIWTDVDGVLSADPKLVKQAKLIDALSYQEAAELAILGAKVLHPRTLAPAMLCNIPVRVLNTFNLNSQGTVITNDVNDHKAGSVTAITSRSVVTLVNIYSVNMFLIKGFLQRIFAIFAKYGISVNLLSVSEVSLSVTLDNVENLELALTALRKLGDITCSNSVGSISLVGHNIIMTHRLMSRLFDILDKCNVHIHMLSYSAADINISIVVDNNYIEQVVRALHQEFIS